MAFAKLYHSKNSKNQVFYYVRYYLPGQSSKDEKRFTIGPVPNRRAKEITERIRAMVIQGIDPNDFFKEQTRKNEESPRLKLLDLTEAYLKYCAISNRPNTIEIKQQAFKKLKSHLGNPPVENVTPEKIEAWMASQKISKTTTNMYLRAIKAMFNWAYKRNMITVNPFLNAEIKPFKVADSDPEDYFSLEEVELILNTLKKKDGMLWRLVYLALETGGRISELLALTGDDIDMKNWQVFFRGVSTKTGQRRFVPLRPQAVEIIRKWKLEADDKVFQYRDRNEASTDFRRFLQKLNLWKAYSGTRSFHTLRHTYASHLLMSGVNIFIVSRWLGHSSVKVTKKNYGHLIPNSVEVELPWNPD